MTVPRVHHERAQVSYTKSTIGTVAFDRIGSELLAPTLPYPPTLFYTTDHVWSLPSTFDLVILQSAYRAVGSRPAWSHRQEHCMRTLLSIFPIDAPNNEYKHHALWDAYYQAISVQRAYKLFASSIAP